ncbi:MAG: DUF916 domain-containing protein [Proteobacteria bacterium]|nr:DUF916 domain-containing protein [Pseudomonadota bacterium]
MKLKINLNCLSMGVLFLFGVGILGIFPSPAMASPKRGLIMTPPRVIFEGKDRSVTVKMVNPEDREYTFDISIVSTRMLENGKTEEVSDPNEEERFAQNMIRFSPRRATIPPNGWQTVRLMVRKPKDLPDGEYRSQLKVTPVIQPDAKNSNQDNNQQGIGITIDIVFGVSIPIIVRQGNAADIRITPHAPKLITKDNEYFLETELERTGLFSVFVDVEAFLIPASGDQPIKLGENKGLAIYTQNKNRMVPLPIKNRDLLTNGKIEIKIFDREKQNTPLISSKIFELD